jgi:hypothetical protein
VDLLDYTTNNVAVLLQSDGTVGILQRLCTNQEVQPQAYATT